jgi:hypothetical protein
MRIVPFAVLAVVAAGTVAIAQTAPTAGQPDRAARWQAHKAEFDAMRKQRADDIALLIGLRADQRPAFDAMLAAMEPPHRDWGAGKPDGAPGAADESMSARLDRMSARIDERSAAEKAKLAALKSFYAGLSPDQRLRFDALERLRHDHGGIHGGRGGRFGGDHGRGPGGPGMPPPAG